MANQLGLMNCYHCGGQIECDNMSIEHKIPWMDSDDPKGLFYDLDNIGFSHLSCNVAAASRPLKKYHTKKTREDAKRKSRNAATTSIKKE